MAKYYKKEDIVNRFKYKYPYIVEELDEIPTVNVPTVDAIPIDWLKKKYPLTGVYGTESYFRKAHIVDELIKEWEAEKEV